MMRLPDDIVANILSRLPVKRLLQFKSVCKLWHTTISDPQFAKLQLQKSLSQENNIIHGNNFKLLVLLPNNMQPISLDYENGNNDQFGETKLDFPLGYEEPFESWGCCDGMLCLEYGDDVVVWNPSINQYRKLPTRPFPPQFSYEVYGFGFDSAADDYKVYWAFRESDKLVLEVFALKTNCWRRVEILTPVPFFHQSRNFLHGSLHWMDVSLNPDRYRFFSFTLASEKLLEIPLPDVRGVKFDEMVVFDGCLCVYCDNNDNSGIEIWIMKEYMVGASWTRMGTVIKDTLPNFVRYLRPLCYSRTGDILLEIDGNGVVKYNMKERSCTTVFNVQYEFIDFNHKAHIEALAYVESLVSPKHDDGARPIID